MALMEGSSQSDLFLAPPSLSSPSPSSPSSPFPRLLGPGEGAAASSAAGIDEKCKGGKGAVHGAGIGCSEHSRVVGQRPQEGEQVGLDCNGKGDSGLGLALAAERQGARDGSGVLPDSGGVGLMDVGGDDEEDTSTIAVRRVEDEFDDYMPLAEVEEGFQFGQGDGLLDGEAGGGVADNLPLATESEGGGEAWIAQSMDSSNYGMGNDGDSIFEEAIREIISKSSQAAAYAHAAEVPETMDGLGGLDGRQQLRSAPQASASLLFTIDDVEVEGVADREQVVGLPQGSGASEFAASRGMDVTTVSDQDLFESEERQQCLQAEGESNVSRNIECGASSAGKYSMDEAARDGDVAAGLQSSRRPPTFQQQLDSSRPATEFVSALEQTSDSPQVASEPQQDAGNVLGSAETEGSSECDNATFSGVGKDDLNPANGDNGTMVDYDEALDGADVDGAGEESEEYGSVGVEDERGEHEGSASLQRLSKEGLISNGAEFSHPSVQPSLPTAAVSTEGPKGQSERNVKQHQSNGVRVSFDRKIVERVVSKGSEKSSGKEKMEAEGPEEGEGVPLWVKWRGKWEAAIRCSVIDCPPTTLKAKPNYSKKKHVVAYFPSARLFSWVDTQHTCPIEENPVPLLAGTHFTQREAVKDGFLPRRRMLLKLGGEILDISDRLHIKAVVERAQNVNVWKTFAKEAAAAITYAELGELLVRLHHTIAPIYIKCRWISQRYSDWTEDCTKAESAAVLQKLTRELINAVRWEDVAPLWNAAEQPELDPEWEHWKGDAFEEKDSEDDRDAQASKAPRDESPIGAQLGASSGSKRFKEQARARRQAQLSLDTIENSSQKRLKVKSISPEVQFPEGLGSSSFGHATTAFRSPLVHLSPMLEGKEPGGSEGPVAFNSGLCTAFLKRKSRRCNRAVKDVTYCGKHKFLADPENSGKELESEGGLAWESSLCSASFGQQFSRCPRSISEGSIFCQTHIHLGAIQSLEKNEDVDVSASIKEARCNGMTTRGIRCTHKPQDGSRFCAKHSIQGTEGHNEEREVRIQLQVSEGSASKRVRISRFNSQNGSPVQIPVGQVDSHHAIPLTHGNELMQGSTSASIVNDGVTRKRKWVSSFFNRQSANHVKSPLSRGQDAHFQKVSDGKGTPSLRCKGRTTRDGEQCSFRARAGHSLCTKHLLASEGGRKLLDEDAKMSSSVASAKGLLERFLKSADEISSEVDDVMAKKQLLRATTTEAAQDYSTAEELLKLVTMEMSRLNTVLRPTTAVDDIKSETKLFLPGLVNGNTLSSHVAGTSSVTEELLSVACGLCALAVACKEDLAKHWKDSHRKEVILFVKGYACRACDQLYSRKHTVRRHWRKRHQSLPVRSPDWTAVCSTCNTRSDSHDILLQHVCDAHPDQLSSPALKASALEIRIPEAVDAAETLECDDCHEEFVTHWDLFHHKERVHKSLKNEIVGRGVRTAGDTLQGDNHESSSQAAPQLFGCRNCVKKFPSLPELHRHADAEHSIGLPGGPSSKSACSSDSGRVKLQIRRKSDEKGSGLWQASAGSRRNKKRGRFLKQSDKSLEMEKEALLLRMKVALHTAQLRNLRQLKRGEVPTTRPRKALYSLTKGGQMLPYDNDSKGENIPDDTELLDVAQSVCCQSKLLTKLHQNYIKLPDQLLVRVSQVCTEANVKLEWLADGYLCPSGCKEFRIAMDAAESTTCEPLMIVKADETKLTKNDADETLKCLPNSWHIAAKSETVVISTDLSNGLEPVPVVCSVEQDVVDSWRRTHKDESSTSETFRPDSFEYIIKRVLNPSLGVDPENYKVGCSCEGHQCAPASCDHVDIFDNDNLDALDIYGQPMKGRFPYDNKGCIILEEGYLVYECNSSCRCQLTCQNRVLQKGVTVKLEVFRTLQKGWAVRAAQMIPRGTFVCEYLGEVLHDEEANKRGERYDQVGCSYLYDIDAHLDTSGRVGRAKPFVIDATKHGNVARFINHSCAPNLVNYQVLVDSMDCQLAHIGLFASRDIESGEELAYDYRYKLLPGKGCPCHCGASNCRGRLY